MIQEIIRFLLMVVASTCGILLGAAIAGAYDRYRNNLRWEKERRNHR